MPDREKVITALEFCTETKPVETCFGKCPYAVADDDYRCRDMKLDALALLKEQEAVVHCGDCENFCFDNISPNAGRCMLTNMSHSKTWFCAHGKSEEGR